MPGKILVADDEEEITEFVKTALEREGYEVITAFHGSKLVEAIKTGKPDVLLLDVLLPGIDGYSLMLQLEQDDTTNELPVIVMTALPASKPLFEKFDQVKMFLVKPFDIDVLINKIKELLS